MNYQPKWMYLTHYGAIDRPTERSVGLRQWISEYVGLCEQVNPQDSEAEQRLEVEMRDMIFSKLSDDVSLDQDKLGYLLNTDIKLNCQGLSIWWRSLQDG